MIKNLIAPLALAIQFICLGSVMQAQISIKCINGQGFSVDPITGAQVPTGEKCANAVTSAVPFLRIVPDARGGAMGDAGIATSTDPNSMHYKTMLRVW